MEARSLQYGASPSEFKDSLRSLFDTPLATLAVTAGAEAANVRRFSLQTIDRLARPWDGRWLVELWVQATATGDPSATGNTVAWVSGTVLETILPHSHFRILTDEDGRASFDLTIAGAATRYIGSVVRGRIKVSDGVTWA